MPEENISVFIIAAVTADGFIAKNTMHTPMAWTSKEDKEFFKERTTKAGVVVMGQNTYQTIRRPLENRLNIVYSKETYEGIETTQKNPKELIEDLKNRGYKEVAICGGATIYTMFLEAGVVDKLYLTVEPIVFGSGMNLFNKEVEKKLQLVSVKNLNTQTLLLEYNVIN